jgi:hypothetical protein
VVRVPVRKKAWIADVPGLCGRWCRWDCPAAFPVIVTVSCRKRVCNSTVVVLVSMTGRRRRVMLVSDALTWHDTVRAQMASFC